MTSSISIIDDFRKTNKIEILNMYYGVGILHFLLYVTLQAKFPAEISSFIPISGTGSLQTLFNILVDTPLDSINESVLQVLCSIAESKEAPESPQHSLKLHLADTLLRASADSLGMPPLILYLYL